MFAGIFSCTPSFSPEINKVYLILSYLILNLGPKIEAGNTVEQAYAYYFNIPNSRCHSSIACQASFSWIERHIEGDVTMMLRHNLSRPTDAQICLPILAFS